MKKLVISLVALVVVAASFIIFSQLNKNDPIGEITIIVVDDIGDTISNKTIGFTETDTLFSILDENYDVGCANSSYNLTTECEKITFSSRVVLKIDSLVTDWNTTYIGIYENDEYSTLGIDLISLNDGDVFRFEYKVVGDDN